MDELIFQIEDERPPPSSSQSLEDLLGEVRDEKTNVLSFSKTILDSIGDGAWFNLSTYYIIIIDLLESTTTN